MKNSKEPQFAYFIGNSQINAIYDNTIVIETLEDYEKNKEKIQSGIDLFNSEIDWDEMWDYEKGLSRIAKPEIRLFLLEADSVIKGFVWYTRGYLHNIFISKTRPDNISVKFIKGTLNFVPYIYINLHVDQWNTKAQRFFEKVGFQKNSS